MERIGDTSDLTFPSDGDSSGRDMAGEERRLLEAVIESAHLTSTRGVMVERLEKAFAERYGVPHATACASGSAAVQAAVAAVDPSPGDEIVTTPITDMGAISAILYQGAIPIFADVDPATFNVTAATIGARITKHTKAIIVTHLFGNPCEMAAIMALAREHAIPVIEDCAQAYLATYDGALVGTIGDIGCFSFQQSKHMTSGEGGIVITKNDAYARRMFLFVNKAWGYGDAEPDHYFLAPNSRLTELQGAVALAQLDKLESVVTARRRAAERLEPILAGIEGVEGVTKAANVEHSYWRYPLRVSTALAPKLDTMAKVLRERGIYAAPRYIQKPAFRCQVIRDRITFGNSHWPWEGAHMEGRPEIVYDPKSFPGAYEALAHVLVLPWNERFTNAHVDVIGEAVTDSVRAAGDPAVERAGGARRG